MNMDENSLAHVHLTKDDKMGTFPLTGDGMSLMNIILIGLTSAPCAREEDHRLHRLLSTLLSMDLPPKEKLEILEEEYDIAKDENREREVSNMCNLSEGILEIGMERGIKQGMERGIEQGESKLNALIQILLSADRIDDIRRASEDGGYRKELYEEYGIE